MQERSHPPSPQHTTAHHHPRPPLPPSHSSHQINTRTPSKKNLVQKRSPATASQQYPSTSDVPCHPRRLSTTCHPAAAAAALLPGCLNPVHVQTILRIYPPPSPQSPSSKIPSAVAPQKLYFVVFPPAPVRSQKYKFTRPNPPRAPVASLKTVIHKHPISQCIGHKPLKISAPIHHSLLL